MKRKIRNNQFIRENKHTYSLESEHIHKAEPFLKWAGGKGQLLNQFEKYLKNDFNKYIEPFIGGGAVFFHLYNKGILVNKKVILIDSNKDLINCYQVIQNNVEKLIKCLSNSKYKNDEKTFYKIRQEEPVNSVERAARLIYLNKTCYNGLYRVNLSGKFNVPYGFYKNPLICNTTNLIAVSKALSNVNLIDTDFSKCLDYAEKNDFIYLDPPYQPISKTSNFTSYTNNSFTSKDQERLSDIIKELNKKGCRVMLSNSDNGFIKKLYDKFNVEIVKARRAINCNGFARGKINELVIYNY
ncbi:MAG TPA: modification methylase [Ignavibacteriales bacterium]|nr:modification methylase [Ignavibacteriales bacterium]